LEEIVIILKKPGKLFIKSVEFLAGSYFRIILKQIAELNNPFHKHVKSQVAAVSHVYERWLLTD